MKKIIAAIIIAIAAIATIATANGQPVDPTYWHYKQKKSNWLFEHDTVRINCLRVDNKLAIDSLGRMWWYDNAAATSGKLLVGNGTYYAPLSIGSAGQVLTVSGGTAAWSTPTLAGTGITGLSNQQILYGKSDGSIDQEAAFYYDESTDLATVTSALGGFYVDNTTAGSLLSYGAVSFYNGSSAAGYYVDKIEMTNGTSTIAIHYPPSISSGYSWNLPLSQGSSGTFLRNDGSGNLSWVSALTAEVDGSTTNEVQNLSYDAGNHEVDISLGGTSATIPLAVADGSTLGLAAFSSSGFTASSGVISQETQMSITTDASGLKLSGDASSPGNRYYYGTDASGTKGWYAHSGYCLQFSAAQFNPADATTYYMGINPQSAGSTAAVNRIYIPRDGTITAAYVVFDNSGTLATTETGTIAIRLNNTTDYSISASVVNDVRPTVYNNTGLSIAVSAGDYIELKWTTPTYATNPTQVRVQGVINIQ